MTDAEYDRMVDEERLTTISRLEAKVERERIENTRLREAFVTMERAANEREAENVRLRERCEHPEDFCGCATNRTGEEVLATCEWHTYPTTFAEKSKTRADLAAANEMCMSAYGSTASEVLTENDKLRELVRMLRRGDCWCEAGIGNPMLGGVHGTACSAIRAALEG